MPNMLKRITKDIRVEYVSTNEQSQWERLSTDADSY